MFEYRLGNHPRKGKYEYPAKWQLQFLRTRQLEERMGTIKSKGEKWKLEKLFVQPEIWETFVRFENWNISLSTLHSNLSTKPSPHGNSGTGHKKVAHSDICFILFVYSGFVHWS